MSGEARRLLLVRHGETAGQSSIRYYGSTDVPLSAAGRAQIEELRPLLAGLKIEALVHSPLGRARDSAVIVRNLLECAPQSLLAAEDLREVDFGAIEGMTAAQIQDAMPQWFDQWNLGQVDAYPDGESLAGFAQRVGSAFDQLLGQFPAGDLLAVVHRGVIKAAMAHLLELSREKIRAWPLDLGSLTVLIQSEGWHLESYNVRPS